MAEEFGNTPTVTRSSSSTPNVFTSYEDGTSHDVWRTAHATPRGGLIAENTVCCSSSLPVTAGDGGRRMATALIRLLGSTALASRAGTAQATRMATSSRHLVGRDQMPRCAPR